MTSHKETFWIVVMGVLFSISTLLLMASAALEPDRLGQAVMAAGIVIGLIAVVMLYRLRLL